MPELPEVETVRRDLEKFLSGAVFTKAVFVDFKNVAPGASFLADFLPGKKIGALRRKGKLLIIDLADGKNSLLLHLKMTGQLIFLSGGETRAGGHSLSELSFSAAVGGELPNKFTRAHFAFNNGGVLFFNDIRKFGYIRLIASDELPKILAASYGPEPMEKDFDLAYFSSVLSKRKIPVKTLILNQKIIAGLGNIYADEALFRAGILPTRPAASLKPEEVLALHGAIKQVIKEAIKARGTTFRNFVDGQGNKGNFVAKLQVYQRHTLPCLRCGRILSKMKLGGRGTHYCQYCQK